MPSHDILLEVNFVLLLFKVSYDPCTFYVCFELMWVAMTDPFIKIVSTGLEYKDIVFPAQDFLTVPKDAFGV